MHKEGSWGCAVVVLLIILCNGFFPVAQRLEKTAALNDAQQENLRIGNAKAAQAAIARASWKKDYFSLDRSKVCRKSARPKRSKTLKIKKQVFDTQIEPPEPEKKDASSDSTNSQQTKRLGAKLLKKIQFIPKDRVEIVSNFKSEDNEKVAKKTSGVKSIEEKETDINLNSNSSADADVNSGDAVWKQNKSETSQTSSHSNIPINSVDDEEEKKNIQDVASNASFQNMQMASEADASKAEPPEHMPSFDEWKKEKLEEEKKKGQSSNGGISKTKPKSNLKKNYAGGDCGAKILATNPESHNSNHILNNQQDEYMLNPCNVKIWFIVELCESVQAHTLEIASFELYSSLLKDFTIYASERYPPREWTFLGQYELVNELGVQKFPLPNEIFGKFIKVEFSNHHGAEHFCVLSMFQIYGTSMVEEIEDIDTAEPSHELDDDSPLGKSLPSGPSASNFLGTAKNVVYKIVEKATNVITGGRSSHYDGNSTEKANDIDNINEMQPHSSIGTGLNIALEELTFSNISKLLYELNKTLGLIDYNGSPHYLSLNFLSHLSQILASCSTCKNHISNLMTASLVESSMACKYLQAVIGSAKFNILCRLFKMYCRPVEQTQISLTNFHGPSAVLLNMFKMYFCSSVLNDQSFTCVSQIFNKSESMNRFIKDQKFSSKLEVKRSQNISSVSSSPSLETQIEGTVQPLGRTASDKKEIVSNELTDAATANVTSAPASSPTDNPSTIHAEQSKINVKESVLEESVMKQSNIVIPSSTSNVAFQSSFILIEPSTDAKIEESSKIQTLPLSAEDGASSSLIQPTKSNTMEAVGSQSSEDTVSSSKSIVPDVAITHKVKPSLSQEPVVENTNNQSPNISSDHDSEMPNKPSASQKITATPQASSQPSPNSQQVAGQPATVNQEVITGGQKESIFMRLTNRIKALELNLSLSSQYLEELSKRYRKQMDQMAEMQKIFNKSMGSLNETSQKSLNKAMHLQNTVENLELYISNLTHHYRLLALEKEMAISTLIHWHVFLVIVQLIAFLAIFVACVKYNTNNMINRFNTLVQNSDNLQISVSSSHSASQNTEPSVNVSQALLKPAKANLFQRESQTITSLQKKNGILVDHNGKVEDGPLTSKVKKKNRTKKHTRSQSNDYKHNGYDPSEFSARHARFSIDNSVINSKTKPPERNTQTFKHSSAGVLFNHVPKNISLKPDTDNGNENKKIHIPGNLNRPLCNKFSVLASPNHETVPFRNNNHRRKYF